MSLNENISYCYQCECFYRYIGASDRIAGELRLKDGQSYCRHEKKCRKLGEREIKKGVAADCPKRLSYHRMRIYRKEQSLSEQLYGKDIYKGIFHPVYEGKVKTDCVEDLRGYLPGGKDACKYGGTIHMGNVVTLFDGLYTTAWVLNELNEFEPVNFHGDFILKRSA